MKVISNFKDYYDYLQGVYGVDEKIVYERACQRQKDKTWEKISLFRPDWVFFPEMYKHKVFFMSLAVGGTVYCFHYYNEEFYWGVDGAKELWFKVSSEAMKTWEDGHLYAPGRKKYWSWDGDYITKMHLANTQLNHKLDCPVILVCNPKARQQGYIKNVRLSDFGLPAVLPAEEAYLKISNFLTREKPVVDNRTNVQKIVGHGFDKKSSFRHPI